MGSIVNWNRFWLVVYLSIAALVVYLLVFGVIVLFDAVWLWRWLHPASGFDGAPI